MANNKQRLFEVMGKVDNSFKPRLNEFYNPQPEGTELNPQEVLNSYLETALWAEGGDGNELDGKTIYDVDDRAKQASLKDIQTFIQQAQQQAPEELANYDAKSLGHNLWLSRNGHGAGFFDDNNDTLQNIARAMKTADIYVGDDGKVYIMGTESGGEQPMNETDDNDDPLEGNVGTLTYKNGEVKNIVFGGSKLDAYNDPFYNVRVEVQDTGESFNIPLRKSQIGELAYGMDVTTFFGFSHNDTATVSMKKYNTQPEQPMNEMPNWGKTRANPAYTHFAVLKTTGKIVNGWDYKGYDQAELRADKKYYFLNDIKDNQIDPKAVIILTKKYLLAHGTNPSDYANWHKNDTDGTDIYTM